MKQSTSRCSNSSRSGFTLVELLVVIGIIAILASVLATAVGPAMRSALRSKALNTANQIQTATINYYTEYSVYPVPANTTKDYSIADNDQTDWGPLIEALSGMIKPTNGTTSSETTISNTRTISFLTLKATDVDTTDAPLNPLPPKTGNLYFNIAMDSDYDNILGVPPSAVAIMPNFATVTNGKFTGSGATTGGSTTTGVAVWANCNVDNVNNPAFWVHTY